MSLLISLSHNGNLFFENISPIIVRSSLHTLLFKVFIKFVIVSYLGKMCSRRYCLLLTSYCVEY